MSSAAVLQAQQLQAALQQVASSGGLTNTSLLPGLLQGGALQGATSTASGDPISSQLSVMLPAQQQVCTQPAQQQVPVQIQDSGRILPVYSEPNRSAQKS